MSNKPKNPNIKPNTENLKGHSFADMDPERLKMLGRMGQKAKTEKEKKKKLLAEVLLDHMDMVADDKGNTVREKGVQSLLVKFMDGDVKAFEVVRDTVGEKPVERVELKASVDKAVDEMEEYFKECEKKL